MAETETPAKKSTKAPVPKANGKKTCTVDGCKRAYRAKGLCFFHYKKWRRAELENRPARFDLCHKEGCKKRLVAHGLCQEHFDAWKASRKSATLRAAAAG